MASASSQIKRGIYGLAIALLLVLVGLKFFGAGKQLLLIFALAGGLYVCLLLMTYRVIEGIAETARNAPQPPPSLEDTEDEDDT